MSELIIGILSLILALVVIFDPFSGRQRITDLVKANHPRFSVYNGVLEDGKLIKLQCNYGYLEIFISANKDELTPTKKIYSQYMEERAHNCQVGFDDAIYLLKKAGFDISSTKFHYREI
jgi:hypothetical protein